VEASTVVARVRRGMRWDCVRVEVCVDTGRKDFQADGARKSRYSACVVAPEVALL
jgi:hypothetical protein